jgi:hypothetical protein
MRAAVLFALGLGACVSPTSDDGAGSADSGTDSTPLVDDLTVDGLTLGVAAVKTVVTASWRTAEPVRADVTATFDGGSVTFSETEPATDHTVSLVGIPALTEVVVRVTADDTTATAEGRVTTGALPTWVPDLTFVSDAPDASEGGITITPVILPQGGGVLGIDDAGRVVWSWPPQDTGMDLRPYRAFESLDGSGVVYNGSADSDSTPAQIVTVKRDGSATTVAEVTGGHTDFAEYTPGGFLSLGWDIRDIEGRRILGDTVREVAPDGTERVVWNVWDHFTPDLDQPYPNLYVLDPTVEDWSHINGIHYDAASDDIYVTTTFNDGVIRIDRATGEQIWTLSNNPDDSDFRVPPTGEPFLALPHSVQVIDGGVLVFNRGVPSAESCSEAVDVALDETAFTAEIVWAHASADCLLVPFLGSAERLAGGNTLIAWTSNGRLDEVTPEGDIAWQVSTALGAAFGFSTRIASLND